MDPVSITAGALSIVKCIASASSTIRWVASLSNAPAEFLDLQNELETTRGYLSTVQQLLKSPTQLGPLSGPAVVHMGSVTRGLELDVDGLNKLLERFCSQICPEPDGQGSTTNIKKIKWRRNISTICYHRDKLRQRRADLAAAVGLLQPYLSQNHNRLILGLEQITAARPDNLGSLVQESTKRLHTSLDTIKVPTDTKEISTELQNAHLDRAVDPPAVETSNTSRQGAGRHHQQLLHIRAVIRWQCQPACSCRCHKQGSVQINTSSWFSAVGTLFLKYNSTATWNRLSCNAAHCHNYRPHDIALTYLFPVWLLRKAICFYISLGDLMGYGASLHLRVPRIIPSTHPVFNVIDHKDTAALQTMISSRVVFPTDVQEDGVSLTLYALIDPDLSAMAEMLLHMTRDIFATDVQGRSIRSISRSAIWAQPISSLQYRVAAQVLEMCGDEPFDTPVQHAVFGGASFTLEEVITVDPESISSRDLNGNTPLHLAGLRDNTEAIHVLLNHGANPNATNDTGSTALGSCIQNDKPEQLQLLIDAGADVNVTNNAGRTPLMEAIRQEAIACFEFLLNHGAKATQANCTGKTPLHLLSHFENNVVCTRMAELLVASGGDVNSTDLKGWTPICFSIWHDSSFGVQKLIELGASLQTIDYSGRSALHIAAVHATAETISALRGRLDGVDPDLKDKEGKTAADYFQKRGEVTGGGLPLTNRDVETFEHLLADLRQHDKTGKPSTLLAEDDEVFHDALTTQEPSA